ncbi:mobilization relaxase, partial [Vibrio parahaemolyticus]|nr:mobilization relaxase [Vibrio parahaemolyticus]
MIVQFARRGKGVGSGPVDYLLGKDRNRERATLNQGNPDLVQSLIDSSPYAKKYTS